LGRSQLFVEGPKKSVVKIIAGGKWGTSAIRPETGPKAPRTEARKKRGLDGSVSGGLPDSLRGEAGSWGSTHGFKKTLIIA